MYYMAVYYSNTNKNKVVHASSRQEAIQLVARAFGPEKFKLVEIPKAQALALA